MKIFLSQGFTERDKLEQHLRRHTCQDGQDGAAAGTTSANSSNSSCSVTTSLAQILKDGLPKEPLPFHSHEQVSKPVSDDRDKMSASIVTSSSSSAISSQSPPALSASSPLSNAGSASPFSALHPGFPGSPFGMIRYPPISVAGSTLGGGSPLMLPPGVSHFLPNNLLLPGLPNPFQRFQTDHSTMAAAVARLQSPNFDPMKANSPLPQMPDVNSMKRASPMGGYLDEENLEQKKFRLQSSMRMLKDEPVPEGYMRFR